MPSRELLIVAGLGLFALVTILELIFTGMYALGSPRHPLHAAVSGLIALVGAWGTHRLWSAPPR